MNEEDFKQYISKVDDLYREKTHKYDGLFSSEENASIIAPLLRGVMYLIDAFLESDKSSLFINIPSFSFGKNEATKEKNHSRFNKAISDVLYASSAMRLASCKDIGAIRDGEIIYVSKKIPLKGSNGTDNSERFFTIRTDEKGKRAIEISALRSSVKWKQWPIKEQFSDFIKKYGPHIVRLQQQPTGQWKNIVDKLNLFSDSVNNYNICRTQNQFEKILIVGTQRYFQTSKINAGLPVKCPIVFSSEFDKSIKDFDLIVFTDNSHIKHTSAIQDKLSSSRDNLRKVIYIGDRCDDRYDCQFEFSYREWFHYITGDNKYPEIKQMFVDFPWLRQSIKELREILEKDSELSQDAKKVIIHRVFYPFMNATIPGDVQDESRVLDIIGDEYGGLLVNTEVLGEVLTWYQNLKIPTQTPKDFEIQRLCKTHKKVFLIPRIKASYKRGITTFIKQKNHRDNCYIFEGVRRCKMDVFADLLEQVALGTYYFLYYDLSDIRYLEDYLIREDEVYSQDYRVMALDKLMPVVRNNRTESTKTLDDFLDVSLFDEIEYKSWIAVNNSYQVSFNDGSEEVLQGDVIVDANTINLDEMYESQDFKGKVITFYKSPENFGELIALYKGQLGQDETYYSDLWKSKLRQLFAKDADRDIKKLSVMLPGISSSVLKPYLKQGRSPLFVQNMGSMRRICKVLNEHRYITLDEMKYILSAKKSREENTKLGRALKQELFDYKLGRNTTSEYDIIKRITKGSEENGHPLIADDLVSISLFRKTIANIKEYKQQENG